jgi:subtilisin family serine protease
MNIRTALALVALLGITCACGGSETPPPPDESPSTLTEGGGGTIQEQYDPTRVLVRPAPGEDIAQIVAELGGTVLNQIEGTNFYLVELPDDSSVEEFLEALEGDARVLDGEPDRVVSAPEGGGATLPIGSEFFSFTEIANQPELLRIGADIARTRATGVGVRVALIDTGVVANHLALQGHIEPGGWDYVDGDGDPTDAPNGLDDDEDGLVDEGFGHGTFISSLILAIAPDVTILPYRVLNSDSTGLASDVAAAITSATDAGVHVINLSLGMEHRNSVVGEAIQYAKNNGVPVIASAGNTGNQEVTFPATISAATSVTSVDSANGKAGFASFGGDVDLAAPGVELIGAYPTGDDVAVKWSGTSFSAALVTGGYALVRELYPLVAPFAVTQHLEATSNEVALQVANGELASQLGDGLLDLDAATLTEE